jgi:ADP-ribosylglycohydrolase
MRGAILGDIIGSVFESQPEVDINFEMDTPNIHFTDDTALTCATAEVLTEINKPRSEDFAEYYKAYYEVYPKLGYGKAFRTWAKSKKMTKLDSYGNGCIMRISPIGYTEDTIEKSLLNATKSIMYTHRHEISLMASHAIVSSIFFLKNGENSKYIQNHLKTTTDYKWDTINKKEILQLHMANCEACMPVIFHSYFNGTSLEEVIRLAISFGGDTDTNAAIAASLYEAQYPESVYPLWDQLNIDDKLNPHLLGVLQRFEAKYKPRITL